MAHSPLHILPLENLFWKTGEHNPHRCSLSLLPRPLSFPQDTAVGPDPHRFREIMQGGNEVPERGSNLLEATEQFCGDGVRLWGSSDSQAWLPSAIPWPVILSQMPHIIRSYNPVIP